MQVFIGMIKHHNHINIGHWNIHGLTEKVNNSVINKLLDSDFVKVFKKLGLFCLSETHTGPDFNVMFQDYHVYKSPSNSIYFKNNEFNSDFLFGCIRQDCADFMTKGDILLMGDFNAYIPNNAFAIDYIEGDELDEHIPLPDDICHPGIPLKIKRNTMEFPEINYNSKLLLERCKSVSARILNGRLVGDTSGRFTRFPVYPNVDVTDKLPSLIDYAVSNVNLLSKVKYFSVSDLTRFSDHCIIKVSLRTNFSVNDVNDAYSHLPLVSAKIIWKSQHKNRLENTLKSAQCQFDIAQFCSTTFDHDQLGVSAATAQLSSIIPTATRLVIPPNFNGRRKKSIGRNDMIEIAIS